MSRGRTQNIEREGKKDPNASAGAAERLMQSFCPHCSCPNSLSVLAEKDNSGQPILYLCEFDHVLFCFFCYYFRKYLCCLLLCMIFS